MKKFFIFAMLLASIVVLSSCGTQTLDLTAEEKVALLQETDAPTFNITKGSLSAEFSIEGDVDENVNVDASGSISVDVYVDTVSEEEFFIYIPYEMDLSVTIIETEEIVPTTTVTSTSTMSVDIKAEGSLYLDAEDVLYVNFDGSIKTSGTKLSVESKQFIDLSEALEDVDLYETIDEALDQVVEYYPAIAALETDNMPEEIIAVLDTIVVSQKNDDTYFDLKVNKSVVESLATQFGGEEDLPDLDDLSADSNVSAKLTLNNTEFKAFSVSCDLDYDNEEIAATLVASVGIELNVSKPSLPKVTDYVELDPEAFGDLLAR